MALMEAKNITIRFGGLTAVSDFNLSMETGELVGLQQCNDVLQSVVSSIAAPPTEPDRPQGEVEVVAHDDEVLDRQVELVHPVADGITAEVHVRGGFEQGELPALEGDLRDVPVALRGKRSIGCLCPGIQYHKTDIVSG